VPRTPDLRARVRVTFAATKEATALTKNNSSHSPNSLAPHLGLAPRLAIVTFSPHLRYNSPRLKDLAIRSNEYLTSKRFLLTTATIRSMFSCVISKKPLLSLSSLQP
jgi:hypothetical protein